MTQIIKYELLRFWRWAAGLMLLHFAFWIMIWNAPNSEIGHLKLVSPFHHYMILAVLATVTGFILGVVQVSLHKRANHWVWLLHRPIRPIKIFASLTIAAALLLMLAFVLPWLLYVAGVDLWTEAVVDFRHYTFGFYPLSLSFAAYLVGCIGVLSTKKGVFLLASLLVFLFGHPLGISNHAPGPAYVFYAVAFIIIAWLFYLGVGFFKPDQSTMPKSNLQIILTAVPGQIWMPVVLFSVIEFCFFSFANDLNFYPENIRDEDSYSYITGGSEDSQILKILSKVENYGQEGLKDQVIFENFHSATTRPLNFPVRGQMLQYDSLNRYSSIWFDMSYWVFSHGEMLLKGISFQTGEVVGWLGLTGFKSEAADFSNEERFATVPFYYAQEWLITPQAIFRIDRMNRKLIQLHYLENDEYYYARPSLGKNVYSIVSNKKTYFFEMKGFYKGGDSLTVLNVIPHPLPLQHMKNMVCVALDDGQLVYYRNQDQEGFSKPNVALLHAKSNGEQVVLYKKEFSEFLGAEYFRYGAFSLSPLLSILKENIVWPLIEPNEKRHVSISQSGIQPSTNFIWTMVVIHFFCALFTAFGCRGSRYSKANCLLWVVMNGLLGLPGVVSFLLLREKQEGPLPQKLATSFHPITVADAR